MVPVRKTGQEAIGCHFSRDSALVFLNEATIAPITSTIRDIPSEVLLTGDEVMPKDCAATWTIFKPFPNPK